MQCIIHMDVLLHMSMDGTMFMIYLEASVSAYSCIKCKDTQIEPKVSNSLHCLWHYCLWRHDEEVIMLVLQCNAMPHSSGFIAPYVHGWYHVHDLFGSKCVSKF